ncbi:MAG: hypothetical protein ABIS84_01115 [Arachnia sp.]
MRRGAAVALMSVLALCGCSLAPSAPTSPEPFAIIDGNSQFTPEGVRDMKSSRQVRFDVSSRPLRMSALGFAPDSDGILVATEEDKKFSVSITTPEGVVEMETDTIRIRPGVPTELVDHIDIFYHFPDASDGTPEIDRAAGELGFRFLENFEGLGDDFIDGSGKETWNPGLGNSTGTVFSVEAILNRTTGSMLWIYSIHLDDRYYTPEVSEEIAETGDYTRA